jgi:hypothetical protein
LRIYRSDGFFILAGQGEVCFLMPSRIPPGFKPDDATINALRKEGIFEDFLEHSVTPHFIEYWEETGEKKKAWQTTYRRWARRAFHGKAGREWEDRHKHQNRNGGMCGDLFGNILDKINGSAPALCGEGREVAPTGRPAGRCRPIHSPIPGEGETMSTEEALKELARFWK